MNLKDLRLENRFVSPLPGKPLPPHPLVQTPGIFYAESPPTPVRDPRVLLWSTEVAELLGLSNTELDSDDRALAARVFSGNELPPGCRPYATRYGGHQFGNWAGQLGDGRALSLGETDTGMEVQLKGAGRTPYSRQGDGRAVLRSSMREFLCSEAMHHLGIPTTRALCCVTTGEPVIRDMFYDGHPAPEPGAIVTRVAPSFLRIGHFEILAMTGELELLRRLTTRTIDVFFPELKGSEEDRLLAFFETTALRTARLVADWQRVGFVHGVLNTDNLSVLGLTIDYGPYGWLDVMDPDWTPNTTDAETRRYRFGNQPRVALWNLARLAEALLPLFRDPRSQVEAFEAIFERYQSEFDTTNLSLRGRRLAIDHATSLEARNALQSLLQSLDALFRETEVDPTLFHRLLIRTLSSSPVSEEDILTGIHDAFYSPSLNPDTRSRWLHWLRDYRKLLQEGSTPLERRLTAAQQLNPVFILRNYLVQEALDALTEGNRAPLDALAAALKTPYEENSRTIPYFRKRPDWARNRAGCSALSCSS